MWARDPSGDGDRLRRPPSGWIDDELIGLDRNDPEVQEFAAHLDRIHRERPNFTVEGYLAGFTDFADSANRAEGGKRLAAVVLVALLLTVAGYLIWDTLHLVMTTLL